MKISMCMADTNKGWLKNQGVDLKGMLLEAIRKGPNNLQRQGSPYLHIHPPSDEKPIYPTLLGILTTPFFRSSCGIPYRAPTPLLPLPSRPTSSTLTSRNRNSHLPASPPGTTLLTLLSSSSTLNFSFNLFLSTSLSSLSNIFTARSGPNIPATRSRYESTSSGCGIRASAGRRVGSKTLPASVRVKCLDSETGWKTCRRVEACTGRSFMGSWAAMGMLGVKRVWGSMERMERA